MSAKDIELGKTIAMFGDAPPRDAIHVAVASATAGAALRPGQSVGVVDVNGRLIAQASLRHVGIVDPFLKREVRAGERFWVLLTPGTVKNLRHEWDHQDFVISKPEPAPEPDPEDWNDDECRGC